MTKQLDSEGFTLVEMLVVLAIIAAVAVVALPYAGNSGASRKLDALAAAIASGLRAAQAQALAKNRIATVTIDLKERTITTSAEQKSIIIPAEASLRIITAQNDVAQDRAVMRFFPEGGSTGGKIETSMKKDVRTIAVNWLTGAVVVSKGAEP
jgi:general secretion pathway protein H